jgi:cell division septation protein DedD
MSDQGFHEVQLSGKQLVFLFMSAVVVMVVVFLLGVNVGRGVRSAVGDTEVLAQSDPSTPNGPDAAAAGSEPAKPAQPELSYHDLLLGANAPADKGAAGDKGTAGADKGAAAEKAPPSEAPPPIAEVPPSQTPRPTPAATPTPATRAPAAQVPAAAAKPKGSDWFLQTGAYATQAVAEGEVAKLKQLNLPGFVQPTDRNGATMFSVRVGPYSDRAQAEQVSSRLKRQGFKSLITR